MHPASEGSPSSGPLPSATPGLGEELSTDGLRGRIARGLGWKMLSQISGQMTQTTTAVVLAHLLVPRDFGLAGMTFVFSGLASTMTDLALGAALVQRKTLTQTDLSTAFWATTAGGLIWSGIGIAVSPLVADFFSTPEVGPLFAAISLGVVLNSLSQTQVALLTREMQFRSLELRQIAGIVSGAATALALAVAGFGPWAIIGQSLCTFAVSTTLVWTLSPWRPRLEFSLDSLRSLGSFGIKTLLSRLLGYANQTGDNLLIGRFIGAGALGIYTIAYNLMSLPSSRITTPIGQVLFAGFSRLQDDLDRLRAAWLRVNRLTSALLVPIFLGMAAVAPDLVTVVFGERWRASIPVLQLLSLGAVSQSFQAFNGPLYQACGRPGLYLRYMVLSTAVTVGGFAIGVHWGVVGVAASFAVARSSVLLVNTRLICRVIRLSLRRAVAADLEILLLGTAMAGFVYLLRRELVALDVPSAVRLVSLTILGATVYFASLAWRAPEVFAEARSLLPRRG